MMQTIQGRLGALEAQIPAEPPPYSAAEQCAGLAALMRRFGDRIAGKGYIEPASNAGRMAVLLDQAAVEGGAKAEEAIVAMRRISVELQERVLREEAQKAFDSAPPWDGR